MDKLNKMNKLEQSYESQESMNDDVEKKDEMESPTKFNKNFYQKIGKSLI